MSAMQVFVSHSHVDNAFCVALVAALRTAGAEVWYDEHNLGSGQLMDVVQRELDRRPVCIVILSPAAFASKWVLREAKWAYELADRDPTRIILPVTAGAITRDDFSGATGWLFLNDFKRVEAPNYQPFPHDEAARRTLRALALTVPGEAPAPVAPQPTETAEDLMARGKALQAQGKHAEALPLFQRATQLAPKSFGAWANLGYTLGELQRWVEALPASEQATTLDPNSAVAWTNKGHLLNYLYRYDEALAACDRALAINPNYALAWTNKGHALNCLYRHNEAMAAYDHALAINPNFALAWYNKGLALYFLHRFNEAIAMYDRALASNPNYVEAWNNKGAALNCLHRYNEALAAYDRSIAIQPTALCWQNIAITLRAMGREDQAWAAEAWVKALGG